MSNELATKDPVTNMCANLEKSFEQALPNHITKEHFARALQTAFRKTPALMQCDPKTIGESVVTAAQLGLMIGVNGQCWLLPYGKECQLIIGYQGLVDLVYRSDKVESVRANVVCENDHFEYEDGINAKLEHKINLKQERGEPYAVYAIANIKGSAHPTYCVMGKEEIEATKKSSKSASSKYSPWNGDFEQEMWKKTAVRRLCKLLPKSTEIISALDFESKQEERMREVQVKQVSDALAPGKRSIKNKPIEPEIDERQQLLDYIEKAIENVGEKEMIEYCAKLNRGIKELELYELEELKNIYAEK